MTTRTKAGVAEEIERIEDLISDLDKRLSRLNKSVRNEASGASGEINEFVSEALAGIMARVRESAGSVTDQVTDRASKIGTDAYKRISDEVEQHPMALLAVAAGIGFLLGMSRRS
jgi:ElaB/YqjD/DUF883 family membrane-anchored ribosome-binding protein